MHTDVSGFQRAVFHPKNNLKRKNIPKATDITFTMVRALDFRFPFHSSLFSPSVTIY